MVIACGLLFQNLTPFAALPSHMGGVLRTTVWIKAKKHQRYFNTENMAQNTTKKNQCVKILYFFTSTASLLKNNL